MKNIKRINYISNLPLNEVSGGWSGINYRLYKELDKRFEVNYIGPINPPSDSWEKGLSKARRILGLNGSFHNLSDRRLAKVRELVEEQLEEADYNFFFGQMPWTSCHFDVPYGVYMDACFSTYLDIYLDADQFIDSDIQRIGYLEASWLRKADNIFWGSDWAQKNTPAYYNIDPEKSKVLWVGGNVPIPDSDGYQGEMLFLFISLNFERKGGKACVEAFKEIKKQIPDAQLMIIGQEPPKGVLTMDGVAYIGLLRKHMPEELSKFQELLQRACFLVHPTTMDTMGAVIIEAGYYGCPTIAPRSFGIPELILENKTGLLVELPFDSGDFVKPLLGVLNDNERYRKMREAARIDSISRLTWGALGKEISGTLNGRL